MYPVPRSDTIYRIPASIDPVHIDIPLSYIHVEPEIWDSYYLASINYLAWSKKGLLTQIAASFCSRHRDYLLGCADIEADARGLEANSQAFFELYANWSTTLPPYTSGQRPDFESSALDTVIDAETISINRRGFANIRIGQFNAVLLRVLNSVNREVGAPKLFGRLTKYHFQTYGTKMYQYQILADDQKTIRPTLPDKED